MTHLNIQQGPDVEIVSAQIIKKLYDIALTVPEPLNGETDAAYASGHILTANTYKDYVDYLAGTIGEGDNGIITSIRQNAAGRFLDLTIDVTNGYYIPFEDENMLSYLLNLGIGSNGAITTVQAAAVTIVSGETNTTITKFNELKYFTNITKIYQPENSISPAFFRNWTALEEIDLTNITLIGNRNNIEGGLNGCTSLKTVNNAGNVSLLVNAFSNCINLENIYGLTGVLTVGCSSFKNCKKLSNATFQNCLILLDANIRHDGDFANCTNISTITLHPNTTMIGGWEFDGCSNLTTINNLENIGYVGQQAFSGCSNLVLNSSDFANVTTINGRAFQNCTSLNIELIAPKLITLLGASFENVPITKIKCLGKVQEIGGGSFRKGSDSNILTEVYLPYECTTIGNAAFSKNTGLTTIKQYVDSIDNWVEGQTPQYTNTSRITNFGTECFYRCTSLSLTPQDIQNATTIGDNAFREVSLLSGTLNLPNLTGRIGTNAFSDTNISSILSLGNVTTIGDNAFNNTNISSITIPNSVKTCSSTIVSNTSVSEIIFPEGVEEITAGLFYTKNNSLTYIEIPSTVTNMNWFFHRTLENSLDNLCTLVIKATIPPTLSYYRGTAINNTRGDKFAGIYVPDSSLTAYQNGANAWLHSSIQAKLKPISQLQTDNPTAWAKYNRV